VKATINASMTSCERAAARSQLVMLALMVAFTCLGLALLSAALDA
jgi:hypothetical protein